MPRLRCQLMGAAGAPGTRRAAWACPRPAPPRRERESPARSRARRFSRRPTPARPGPCLVFEAISDASGAVALGGSLFVVGDDEDNILRIHGEGILRLLLLWLRLGRRLWLGQEGDDGLGQGWRLGLDEPREVRGVQGIARRRGHRPGDLPHTARPDGGSTGERPRVRRFPGERVRTVSPLGIPPSIYPRYLLVHRGVPGRLAVKSAGCAGVLLVIYSFIYP